MKQTMVHARRISAVAIVAAVIAMMLQIGSSQAANVTVSTSVQTTLTLAVDANDDGTFGDSSFALGNLTPGTPVLGSTGIRLKVDTNAAQGYDLAENFTAAGSCTTALCHTDNATEIADKTGFDQIASCNAATWSGTGFGFTVFMATTNKETACWGTGTTYNDANNKYSGLTASAKTIHQVTSGPVATNLTKIGFKLDVPSTQKSGTYSATTVFGATANP
jgi:hypothetical protein